MVEEEAEFVRDKPVARAFLSSFGAGMAKITSGLAVPVFSKILEIKPEWARMRHVRDVLQAGAQAASSGKLAAPTATGRFLQNTLPTLIQDAPVFIAMSGRHPALILGALNAMEQAANVQLGAQEGFDEKAMLKALLFGQVMHAMRLPPALREKLPAALRSDVGGAVARISKGALEKAPAALVGSGISPAVELLDPLTNEKWTPEDFLSTWALFVTMDLGELAVKGATGRLRTELVKEGLTPADADLVANKAVAQGNLSFADVLNNLAKNKEGIRRTAERWKAFREAGAMQTAAQEAEATMRRPPAAGLAPTAPPPPPPPPAPGPTVSDLAARLQERMDAKAAGERPGLLEEQPLVTPALGRRPHQGAEGGWQADRELDFKLRKMDPVARAELLERLKGVEREAALGAGRRPLAEIQAEERTRLLKAYPDLMVEKPPERPQEAPGGIKMPPPGLEAAPAKAGEAVERPGEAEAPISAPAPVAEPQAPPAPEAVREPEAEVERPLPGTAQPAVTLAEQPPIRKGGALPPVPPREVSAAGWEAGTERPFSFDPNSTENEGRFRLAPPEEFHRTWTAVPGGKTPPARFGLPETPGVQYIVGYRHGKKGVQVQAIRFKRDQFTEAEAADWYAAHAEALGRPAVERPEPAEPKAEERTEGAADKIPSLEQYAAHVARERARMEAGRRPATEYKLSGVGPEGRKVWATWLRNMQSPRGNLGLDQLRTAEAWFRELYEAGKNDRRAPMHPGGRGLEYYEEAVYEAGQRDRAGAQPKPSRKLRARKEPSHAEVAARPVGAERPEAAPQRAAGRPRRLRVRDYGADQAAEPRQVAAPPARREGPEEGAAVAPAPPAVAVHPVLVEAADITRKGNAVAFTSDGLTITGGYLPGLRAWHVTLASDATALPDHPANRRFATREEAAAYVQSISDWDATRRKAWWKVRPLPTEAAPPAVGAEGGPAEAAVTAERVTALDALNARQVPKPPRAATFLRVTDAQGRQAVQSVRDLAPLADAGPFSKAEWGTRDRKGNFIPLPEQPPQPVRRLRARKPETRDLTTANAIARRVSELLQQSHTPGMHAKFASGVIERDIEKLTDTLATFYNHNPIYRKVFQEATGITLPKDKGGTRKALEDYAAAPPAARPLVPAQPETLPPTPRAVPPAEPSVVAVPTIEQAQTALKEAEAKTSELRKASDAADKAARQYGRDNNLFSLKYRGYGDRLKESAPKAKVAAYRRLQKVAAEADAALTNHMLEVAQPAERALRRAQYAANAQNPKLAEVQRLAARHELARRGTPEWDAIDAEVATAADALAREMYPDATAEEARQIGAMIGGLAGRTTDTPMTVDSLRKEAEYETRLQLQPVRQARIAVAMQQAGVAQVERYHETPALSFRGRTDLLPSQFVDAFTAIAKQRDSDTPITARQADAFIASIPAAVAEARAKLEPEERAEKAKAAAEEAEAKRIAAVPVEEAPEGPKWKPATVPKQAGERDAVLKSAMPRRPTILSTGMLAVEKGVGKTTDMEVTVEMPVALPDGLYTQPPKSKTWIKNATPLDEFPPSSPLPDTAHKLTFAGMQADAFRRGLRAVEDAQSTDETRFALNSVLLEVRDGEARLVATDGRRLHMAELGTVDFPDVELILPTKAVTVLLKSNGLGPITVRVEGKTVPRTTQLQAEIREAKTGLDQARARLAEDPESTARKYEVQGSEKELADLKASLRTVGDRQGLTPGRIAEISDGNATVRTKLVEATYPVFRQVIPAETDQTIQIEVDRRALGQAVADVAPFLRADPEFAAKQLALRVTVGPHAVRVLAAEGGKHYHRERTVPVLKVVKGAKTAPIVVGLNPDYLAALLAQSDSPTVLLGLQDASTPVTARDPDGKRMGVLMPMRLEGETIQMARAEDVSAGRFEEADELARAAAEGGEAQAAVTPEQDAAYLRAVEAGDTATAQRMVDEAARAAGLKKLWHASRFHPRKITSDRRMYFFTGPKMAKGFSENEVRPYYVRIDPTKTVQVGHGEASFLTPRDVADFRSRGIDALQGKMLDGRGKTEIVVLNPQGNVVSADPITRDDQGRVIPLSERFTPRVPDVRFAAEPRPVTPEQDAAYLRAVEAGDTATAQRMVDEAAKAAGKASQSVPDDIRKAFGTVSWKDAGYVLPDGAMLGRVGRHNEIPARMGYGSGQPASSIEDLIQQNRWQFMVGAARATRFANETGISASGALTDDQAQHLETAAAGQKTTMEFTSPTGTTLRWESAESPSAARIQAFFSDPITRDSSGRVIPLSERFAPRVPDVRGATAQAARGEFEQPTWRRYADETRSQWQDLVAEVQRGSEGAARGDPTARIVPNPDFVGSDTFAALCRRAERYGRIVVPVRNLAAFGLTPAASRGIFVDETAPDPAATLRHELYHAAVFSDDPLAFTMRGLVNTRSPAFATKVESWAQAHPARIADAEERAWSQIGVVPGRAGEVRTAATTEQRERFNRLMVAFIADELIAEHVATRAHRDIFTNAEDMGASVDSLLGSETLRYPARSEAPEEQQVQAARGEAPDWRRYVDEHRAEIEQTWADEQREGLRSGQGGRPQAAFDEPRPDTFAALAQQALRFGRCVAVGRGLAFRGLTPPTGRGILVNADQSETDMADTLRHELFHAAVFAHDPSALALRGAIDVKSADFQTAKLRYIAAHERRIAEAERSAEAIVGASYAEATADQQKRIRELVTGYVADELLAAYVATGEHAGMFLDPDAAAAASASILPIPRYAERPELTPEEQAFTTGAVGGQAIGAEAEREKAKAARKRLRARTVVGERKKAAEQLRELAGEAVEDLVDESGEVQVPASVMTPVRRAFREGRQLGVQVGREEAQPILGAVAAWFSRAAGRNRSLTGLRYINALEREAERIRALREECDAISDPKAKDAALTAGLKRILGPDYMPIRHATAGKRELTLRAIEAQFQEEIGGYYAARTIHLLARPTARLNKLHPDVKAAYAAAIREIPQVTLDARAVAADVLKEYKKAWSTGEGGRLGLKSPKQIEWQQAKLDRITEALAARIARRPWREVVDLYKRLAEIVTDSENLQYMIRQGRRIELHRTAKQINDEIGASPASYRELRGLDVKGARYARPTVGTPRWTASKKVQGADRGMFMAGGDRDALAARVFGEDLLDGETAALTMYTDLCVAADEAMRALRVRDYMHTTSVGKLLGRTDRLQWETKHRTIPVGDQQLECTDAELMNLYAMLMDPSTRAEVRKGVMIKIGRQYGRNVGIEIRSVDGQPEIDALFAALTDRQKAVAEALFRIINLPGNRSAVNRTSVALWGRELAESDQHWSRRRDVSDKEWGRDLHAVQALETWFDVRQREQAIEYSGFTKERISNKHALVTDDIFRDFDRQVHFISTFAHLAIPLANARTLLNFNREGVPLAQTIRDRFGQDMVQREMDMLQRVAGLKTHGDDWTPAVRWLEHRARSASVAILWGRLTSIAFNRIGGSFLMGARIAAQTPRALPFFMAKIRLPSKSYWLLPSRRAARTELMRNGYFFRRWRRDLIRVQANLPSERGVDLYASASRFRWRQIQDMGLAPMAEAELKNAIEAYLALQQAGHSKAEAMRMVERWTRQTQNPSSALDETAMYEDVKKSGAGILLPFTGQPSVAASMLTRDLLVFRHARKTGQGRLRALRNIGLTTFALALNVALIYLVRKALRGAARGFPPKDDKDRAYELLNVSQEVLDLVAPGSGRVLDAAQSLVGRGEIRDISLIGRTVNLMWRGFRDIQKGSAEGNDEQVERGVIWLIEGVGMWGGLPVGGPLQTAKAAAGLLGEPMGERLLEEEPAETPGARPVPRAPRYDERVAPPRAPRYNAPRRRNQ